MVKFVIDADAAIKLARTGVLEALVQETRCFMTKQVYNEVMRGKEKLYEDAFMLERLVSLKKIKIVEIKACAFPGLGNGECSAMALFYALSADAILSDDRKFLSVLEEYALPFMTPATVIAFMAAKKILTPAEARTALNSIKDFIENLAFGIFLGRKPRTSVRLRDFRSRKRAPTCASP